jgi:hypothetical protein
VQHQPGRTPADALQSLSQRLGLPNLFAKNTTGAVAGTAHGLVARVEQALGIVGTSVVSTPTAVTEAAEDVTGAVPDKVSSGVTSAPDLNPTNTAALKTVQEARVSLPTPSSRPGANSTRR